MAQQIQLRRGTASQWTTADPVLAEGEIGLETDTGQFKFGDGLTAWASLGYSGSDSGGDGITSVAYAATVTPNADTTRNLVIGALTGNLTIANPTGTPADCQPLRIRVKQDGTGGRTVALGAAFRLPTGSSISIDPAAGKTSRILAEWNATDSKWDITGNLPGH